MKLNHGILQHSFSYDRESYTYITLARAAKKCALDQGTFGICEAVRNISAMKAFRRKPSRARALPTSLEVRQRPRGPKAPASFEVKDPAPSGQASAHHGYTMATPWLHQGYTMATQGYTGLQHRATQGYMHWLWLCVLGIEICHGTPPPARIGSRDHDPPPEVEVIQICYSDESTRIWFPRSRSQRSLLVGWLALHDLHELVIP